MFDTILVPVEENTMSLRAVAGAVHLAQELGGRVLLLHVVEALPVYTTQVALHFPEGQLQKVAEEHGKRVLDGFRARVPEELLGEAILRHAEKGVWREIVDAAEEIRADLIVIGTHGREGVARAMLGSVAERVARHAEVPVMLVR